MANSIDYASIFNQQLDEKFAISLRTGWMENTTPGIVYDGGKYVKIPKMSVSGFGNMQGYKAPDMDHSLTWEDKELQFYRGGNFAIGRYDVNETNFVDNATNVIRTVSEQEMRPEVDKVRIAGVAQAALSAGNAVFGDIDESTALDALLYDIECVQDKIGEDEQLYVQIATTTKGLVERSTQAFKFINLRDYTVRSITTQINAINDQFLIGTPSAYMKTGFKLNDGRSLGETNGGVEALESAGDVSWIIASRRALDALAYPQVTKIINPDLNQDGEYWKIMMSLYHGIWVFDNKVDGILVRCGETLPTLTVGSVAGTSGKSVISITEAPVPGAKAYYVVDSAATAVTAGTAIDLATWTALPDDGIITAASGKHCSVVYAYADSLLPLAYGDVVVVAGA